MMTTTNKVTPRTVYSLLEKMTAKDVAEALELDYDAKEDAVLMPGWLAADEIGHVEMFPLATRGELAARSFVCCSTCHQWSSNLITVWRVALKRDASCAGGMKDLKVNVEQHMINLG